MTIEPGGTKERIFDEAIRLIAQKGFESVSMRDIAAASGIKAASIYNHFASKEDILDSVYGYYREHRTDNRNAVGHIRAAMEYGSALELVTALYDSAFNFEEKMAVRMILISKIVLARIFSDPRAGHCFMHEWFETDMEHLRKWLGYAVKIGRLPLGFDIENFSVYFWRQLIMMAVCAFVNPLYKVSRLDEEEILLRWFAGLLPLGEPLAGGREDHAAG
jgi:AcrR family transcriptional regulator